MVRDLLDQQAVITLRDSINGLHTGLDAYARATSAPQRDDKFKAVLSATDLLRAQFIDNQRPWVTLTYLVTFGTIRLGLLREEYLFYQAIYGLMDPKPLVTISYLKVC